MIWDQTYGDFGTYEEAQITTAAKGADSMNPGLTMNLVLKSGSSTFKGLGAVQYQSGDTQSTNVTQELLDKGCAPGTNKFTELQDYYGEVGGPILKDRLWFYASHRDASSGNLIPGFVRLSDREQVEFYTKLQDPTGRSRIRSRRTTSSRACSSSAASGSRIAARADTCRSNRRRTRTRGRWSARR